MRANNRTAKGMTPESLRERIDELGIPVSRFARLLGYRGKRPQRSLENWLRGERPIPTILPAAVRDVERRVWAYRAQATPESFLDRHKHGDKRRSNGRAPIDPPRTKIQRMEAELRRLKAKERARKYADQRAEEAAELEASRPLDVTLGGSLSLLPEPTPKPKPKRKRKRRKKPVKRYGPTISEAALRSFNLESFKPETDPKKPRNRTDPEGRF